MQFNKNFHSIKFQIIVAFTLLVLTLVALNYFYSLSHKIFNKSFIEFLEAEDAHLLLSQVEKNVVDLQRNVLIFKENASNNTVIQTIKIYNDISALIKQLHALKILGENTDSLESIQTHLDSYKSNFDIVVGMRNQQKTLIANHLNAAILEFSDVTDDTFKIHFLSAKSESLLYLASYDTTHIKLFRQQINKAKNHLKKHKIGDNSEKLAQHLDDYAKNFSTIVAITRHYIFLINVVMTGSANEIFYNAAQLQEQYYANANKTRILAKSTLEKQQFLSKVFLALGSALTLTIAMALYFRITRPIESITSVFISLSAGKKVDIVPGLNRKDEIGLLASAANVFKSRNEETQELLLHSEQLNRVQAELNEALSLEKTKVEQALRIKTDFLANMSHELRTPLNSIIGYTVRLLKRSEYNERTTSALSAIEKNGRHLLYMINDILDLSKIDANKLELNILPIDIEKLCEDCVQQIRQTAEDKRLVLEFKGAPTPATQTDPGRLTQILLNLLSNSIKYTERGKVTLKVIPNSELKHTQISVIDTGVGIRNSDQSKLFSRFEQFDDNSRFKIGQGTGLGLAIVSKLARHLGIKIEFNSEFGVGSTFSIIVPFEYNGPLDNSLPFP